MQTTWTKHDERQLQRAIKSRDFWQASLANSLKDNFEGERSRTERRWLIAHEEKTIAALLARKASVKEAA